MSIDCYVEDCDGEMVLEQSYKIRTTLDYREGKLFHEERHRVEGNSLYICKKCSHFLTKQEFLDYLKGE